MNLLAVDISCVRVCPTTLCCFVHFFISAALLTQNSGSAVGIATDYCLDDLAQTGSGVHPDSYTMGTGVLSSGVKQPGREAEHWPLTTAEGQENMGLYINSRIRL
jgi:hypothetical protein